MNRMVKKRARNYYDPARVVDAPEHHGLARAMGALTWSNWDHSERSQEERVRDFVAAFPVDDPTRYLGRVLFQAQEGAGYGPAPRELLLERFLRSDWSQGSLHELLARFGLKMPDGPAPSAQFFVPDPLRKTAQKRNHKLRVLHGGVDIEAENMDSAKLELLDRQEKQRAAQDIRAARVRMADELAQNAPKGDT